MATDKKSTTTEAKEKKAAPAAPEANESANANEGANEGEGNRTAARHYDKEQTEFAHSGKVEPAARAAEKAMEGDERKELERAEAEGRRHIAEEDPEVKG